MKYRERKKEKEKERSNCRIDVNVGNGRMRHFKGITSLVSGECWLGGWLGRSRDEEIHGYPNIQGMSW